MLTRRNLVALIALMFAAACMESPTASRVVVPTTDGPSYDGGWTAGSGNSTASDDSGAVTGSDTATCDERGGWTAGSGNKATDPAQCTGSEGV